VEAGCPFHLGSSRIPGSYLTLRPKTSVPDEKHSMNLVHMSNTGLNSIPPIREQHPNVLCCAALQVHAVQTRIFSSSLCSEKWIAHPIYFSEWYEVTHEPPRSVFLPPSHLGSPKYGKRQMEKTRVQRVFLGAPDRSRTCGLPLRSRNLSSCTMFFRPTRYTNCKSVSDISP
jgi:hypothetical protein